MMLQLRMELRSANSQPLTLLHHFVLKVSSLSLYIKYWLRLAIFGLCQGCYFHFFQFSLFLYFPTLTTKSKLDCLGKLIGVSLSSMNTQFSCAWRRQANQTQDFQRLLSEVNQLCRVAGPTIIYILMWTLLFFFFFFGNIILEV